MKQSFSYGQSPMIVGVIRERTVKDALIQIKNGEISGARGFDLHLDALDEEFRTVENIKKIVDYTNRPILALTYNNGYFDTLDMNEEERTNLLLNAAKAGCSAVDMQGYSFDTEAKFGFKDDDYIPEGMEFLKDIRPKEVAISPQALEKQKEFVKKIHDLGCEVLISMHFGVHMNAKQLESCARLAHDIKGADIVKMVTPCETREQLAEVLSSTVLLSERLGFPFSYHASGKEGYKTRFICPMLGSHVMFCNVNYGQSSNYEQLHLESMIEAYRKVGEL